MQVLVNDLQLAHSSEKYTHHQEGLKRVFWLENALACRETQMISISYIRWDVATWDIPRGRLSTQWVIINRVLLDLLSEEQILLLEVNCIGVTNQKY